MQKIDNFHIANTLRLGLQEKISDGRKVLKTATGFYPSAAAAKTNSRVQVRGKHLYLTASRSSVRSCSRQLPVAAEGQGEATQEFRQSHKSPSSLLTSRRRTHRQDLWPEQGHPMNAVFPSLGPFRIQVLCNHKAIGAN